MRGEYVKYKVEMELMNDQYRMWKGSGDENVCMLESYKEKRSIYFAVGNLLPSSSLAADGNREYRLILMGVSEGELVHKDFGSFFVSPRGDGNFYRKFGGPELTCYTHCILVASERETGKTETVMSGQTPFGMSEEAEEECAFDDIWSDCIKRLCEDNKVDIFAAGVDETSAVWHRIARDQALSIPRPMEGSSAQIEKYNHYIIGKNSQGYLVGIPGRFLKSEQPGEGEDAFALWQPIKGGEKYFDHLSQLTGDLQEEIFGYWIGQIDPETGQIFPI